jgi:ABC-type multidrug transport system fused ATPase/permease subunit
MANNSVYPIMSTLSEIKFGAPLIRAMHLSPFFAARESAFIGAWTHYSFITLSLQSWSSHVGGILAFILGCTTALYIVGNRSLFSQEIGGLALTYAAVVPFFINIVSEFFVQMRTAFAALERLLEYLHLPQEPPHTLPTDPLPAAWPTAGQIEFRQLCMRYRPRLPLALIDLTATVAAGSKVGIVGRTGAGKSTLVLALFRLVEPASGFILIDGKPTSELGLRALRRAMTIIPQDPVLNEGTVA